MPIQSRFDQRVDWALPITAATESPATLIQGATESPATLIQGATESPATLIQDR